MRFNVHLLTHLTKSVTNWGPLWVHSTAGFESWNHRLMKSVKSTKGASHQIVSLHLIKQFVSKFRYDDQLSESVRTEIQTILFGSQLNSAIRVRNNTYVLGKSAARTPTDRELQLLEDRGFHCDELKTYERMVINNSEYGCSEKINERSDNRFLQSWDESFYSVRKVVVFGQPQVYGLFINMFDVE